MPDRNLNLKNIKKINKYQSTSDNSTFFIVICRFLSYYVTLLFLKLNISSNATSYFNFLLGVVMMIFFIQSTFLSYSFAILILLIMEILDCVDGNISRLKKTSSFYGRFIDSLFGIVTISFHMFGLSIFSKFALNNEILFYVGIVSTCVSPFGHFIFDKYSALARWQNLSSKNKIKPYIWKDKFKSVIFFIKDSQYFLIILSPFFLNTNYIDIILYYYFISNTLLNIYMVFFHTKSSYKQMNVFASDHNKKKSR